MSSLQMTQQKACSDTEIPLLTPWIDPETSSSRDQCARHWATMLYNSNCLIKSLPSVFFSRVNRLKFMKKENICFMSKVCQEDWLISLTMTRLVDVWGRWASPWHSTQIFSDIFQAKKGLVNSQTQISLRTCAGWSESANFVNTISELSRFCRMT